MIPIYQEVFKKRNPTFNDRKSLFHGSIILSPLRNWVHDHQHQKKQIGVELIDPKSHNVVSESREVEERF